MFYDGALSLVLHSIILFGITICLGDQTCSRNDCSLPATEKRGPVDCSLTLEGERCGLLRPANHFPPKPEKLDVKVFKTGEDMQFNITWQPGNPISNVSVGIEYLEGYQIEIKTFDSDTACYEMKFTNRSQTFHPNTDGRLVLYTDCYSGFGLEYNKEYWVSVQSLPVPLSNVPTLSSQRIKITEQCKSHVEHGDVDPSQDFYIVGDVVDVVCEKGYMLIGPSTRQCLQNGWDVQEINCTEIKFVVHVQVFANQSVLVKFDTFPNYSQYTVRLKNMLNGPSPPSYRINTSERSKMYPHVEVGTWKACVSDSFNNFVETCSESFTISDPTTSPMTTSPMTTSPTTTSTTISYFLTLQAVGIDNPTKNMAPYIYSIVGCFVGIILVGLVYILKRGRHSGPVHSPFQDSDETIASSVQSSIAENKNECSEVLCGSTSQRSYPDGDLFTISSDNLEVTLTTPPGGYV